MKNGYSFNYSTIGILNKVSHGFSLNEENVHIPLKRFMVCDECEKPLSGYLNRKKNIYYYKCKTKACWVSGDYHINLAPQVWD